MGIQIQTVLITLIMALCFAAPRISKQIEARSKIFLLIGTGGLVSLYFADLLPDVVHLGGAPSLGIILFVWLAYSYLHTFHMEHHEHEPHSEGPQAHTHAHIPDSSTLLVASMVCHCFSSGALLFLSHELSAKVAASVFLALIGHKGYEALSVSVLLSQRTKSRKKFVLSAIAYSLSFPIGVASAAVLTERFGTGVSPAAIRTVIIVVASIAVGSLAGCMVNDFLLPSLRHLKNRLHEGAWVLLGACLTLIFTVAFPG